MKKTLMLVFAVAGIGFAAFAIDYTWTGNAGDGLWTSPGNCNQNSGYPQISSVYARFNKPATVTVDTGAVVDVGLVTVNTGSLVFDGALDLAGLDAQGGTVKIGEKLQPWMDGTADLSIAKTGATLDLDYDGEAVFKAMSIGRQSRGAGAYSATQGATIVKRVLAGRGSLRILNGNDPSLIILTR